MTLASRHLEGDAPTDWVQAPEASVRLAFENLLTPLNGKICDRSKRIARAYLNSEVVQKDAELGQGWLQFAASLGDAQAAWKIYELQRKAEEVAPNTALRLRYLKQAAGAGLPYAKIALGQVYERGALLPKDLNRALSLYRDVARTGDRAGQVRLALFLEEHKWTYPELRAEKGDILKALTERSDAPPWAFTRLAHYVAQSLGPWNATSRNLLVTAVDLGDREALMRLASLLLADRTQPSNFDAAVDFLTEAVSLHGSTGAAKKLYDAYMCKSPYAPEVAEAGFWRAQYLAADPPLLSDRGSRSYPALQAQALYLRPSALRLWFDHLDRMDARDPMALFWEDYAAGFAQMRDAQRVLAQSSTLGLQEKADFSALLAKAFSSGNPSGLTKLLDALGQNSNKLEPLLLDYARDGSGAAVRLLAHRRDEDLGSTVKSLLPDLLRMGDFEALLLAAPFAVDRARVLDRAIGIMPCDFKSAMQIARVAGRIGDFDRLKQYLSIAEHLHEDKPWALMHLADAVLQWQGVVAAHRAAALYKRAFEAGEVNAGRKWLALLSLPETGVYDQTKARLVSQRLAELAGGL
jgi:TPR repeat protein